MNLRDQAAADTRLIVQDSATGFGQAIKLTDPTGANAVLTGFSADIGLLIDPETGTPIAGRSASIALNISVITAAGLQVPAPIEDPTQKPFVVELSDINGNDFTFKVKDAQPDRTIDLITCDLELYKP